MSIAQNKYSLKRTFLFCYSILLVVLLLASANNNSSILLYLLIIGSSLLLLNPVYLIPVYFVSSLSSPYFAAGDNIGTGRIIGFILIISGLVYMTRSPHKINKKNLFYIVLISIFAFVSSTFSLTHSFHTFLMFMQYFAIVILLGQFRDVDLNEITLLLIISSVLTILFLIFTLRDNLISIQLQRLSTSDDVNANRFAMMVEQLCAVTFAAFLIFNKRKIIQVILLLIILLSYYMLILSGSRSATFGITLAIIIILIFLLKKQARKFIFPFLLFAIVGFIFIDKIQQMNIPLIDRFTAIGIKNEGGSQERFATWKTLTPIVMNDYPFFGCGFGAENVVALAKKNGLDKPAHNFLIDMFLQTGIFGIIIFFSYFIFVGKKISTYTYESLIYMPVSLLLAALFNGIGETVFSEKLFWNDIALAWLYMNNLYPLSHYANISDNEPI